MMLALAILALVGPGLAGGACAASATFRGLGDLPGGDYASGANGVSNDGGVVVGWSMASGGQRAFRWTPTGGMATLESVDRSSYAWDVNLLCRKD